MSRGEQLLIQARRNVAAILRICRESKQIKLREMAKTLSMPPGNLCRYEKGTATPGMAFLDKYADALGYEVIVNVSVQRKGMQ